MQELDDNFLAQFHEVLLRRSSFLKECTDNGLEITDDRLSFYEQLGLVRPMAVDEEEKFYSPFQLLRICVIERCIDRSLERTRFVRDENGHLAQELPFQINKTLDLNRDFILHQDDEFYRIVALLHHLEPFYCDTFSITTSLVNLGFDRRGYQDPSWLVEKRKSGIAKEIIAAQSLGIELIRQWQSHISSIVEDIDPLANWYHLLRNFGQQDRQKIKRLKGPAALARLFYRMEEILRGVIEDVTQEKVLNPYDIRDLRGGSWRIARDEQDQEIACSKCGKKPVWLRTLHARHQEKIMCQECTKDYFHDVDESQKSSGIRSNDPTGGRKTQSISTQTPLLCDNPGCKKILIKGLNEGFIVDETPSGLLAVDLEYGEMLIRIKCKSCGKVTMRDISIGWDTSPNS